MQGGFAVLRKAEAHARVGQRVARHQRIHSAAFGGILFEKFEPGRYVIEQVFHADHRPNRCADRFQPADQPAFHAQARTRRGFRRSRAERQARDRANRGQGLAPEAQGGNIE